MKNRINPHPWHPKRLEKPYTLLKNADVFLCKRDFADATLLVNNASLMFADAQGLRRLEVYEYPALLCLKRRNITARMAICVPENGDNWRDGSDTPNPELTSRIQEWKR